MKRKPTTKFFRVATNENGIHNDFHCLKSRDHSFSWFYFFLVITVVHSSRRKALSTKPLAGLFEQGTVFVGLLTTVSGMAWFLSIEPPLGKWAIPQPTSTHTHWKNISRDTYSILFVFCRVTSVSGCRTLAHIVISRVVLLSLQSLQNLLIHCPVLQGPANFVFREEIKGQFIFFKVQWVVLTFSKASGIDTCVCSLVEEARY